MKRTGHAEIDDFLRNTEFYQEYCTKGSRILEPGCSTGRISRTLASSGYTVVELGICFSILKKNKKWGRALKYHRVAFQDLPTFLLNLNLPDQRVSFRLLLSVR